MNIIDELNIELKYGNFVTLNQKKVKDLVELHGKSGYFKKYAPYDWSDNNFWLENDEYSPKELSNFFTIGNSINFKYWTKRGNEISYCEGVKGGIPCRGAKYMWRCLKLAVKDKKFSLNKLDEFIDFNNKKYEEIFTDDNGKKPFNIWKEERIKNIIDTASKLKNKYNDDFMNLLESTNHSLKDYLVKCKDFRAYDDPLCKLSMVNAFFVTGRKLYSFDQPLFPGIDYQLMKQMLRINAITPTHNLLEKLMNNKILSDDEASEIRNATFDVFSKIMDETKISGEIIDNKWWKNREICLDEKPKCVECMFNMICDKKTEIYFPLEETRYY